MTPPAPRPFVFWPLPPNDYIWTKDRTGAPHRGSFFDIEPLTAIKTRKTVLMPVIPVLIPVAAGPMTGLFWPFLTRKKSLTAEISCRPENIRRLFVIIAPGFEQPILQNVIGRPYTSKQPQSQL